MGYFFRCGYSELCQSREEGGLGGECCEWSWILLKHVREWVHRRGQQLLGGDDSEKEKSGRRRDIALFKKVALFIHMLV